MTPLVWPCNVLFSVPVFVFHILIVLSQDADARSPFGNIIIDRTQLVWPVKVLFKVPSVEFQIFIVLSDEPLAMSPFGATAKAYIADE